MSTFIMTPNMNLPNPVPGVDPGPDYADNQYNATNILDGHNHSTGSGVQIQPNGLNINAALDFQGSPATNLESCVFSQQASLSTLNAIFVGTDGNLYFNDGVGDPSIQITAGGLVNATASGISSGAATASFVGGILVVNQAANTPASIKAGSYLMGQTGVAASNFLTLVPPASLSGGSYTLTMPAIPASLGFLTIDTSGNIGTASGVQGGQLAAQAILGTQLANQTVTATQILNATITTTQIASATILGTNIAAATIAASNLSGSITPSLMTTSPNTASLLTGSYTNATTSYTTVTSVTVTATSGRPVFITFIGSNGYIGASSTDLVNFRVVSNVGGITTINDCELQAAGSSGNIKVPPSSMNCVDFATGSVVYTLQGKGNGSSAAVASSIVMRVFQI